MDESLESKEKKMRALVSGRSCAVIYCLWCEVRQKVEILSLTMFAESQPGGTDSAEYNARARDPADLLAGGPTSARPRVDRQEPIIFRKILWIYETKFVILVEFSFICDSPRSAFS